jgi:predicted site-specific integrase-resolvase
MLVGYARVSTNEQTLDLQKDALEKIGCTKIYSDVVSGSKAETPLLYFSEYQVNYHLAMAVCCLANKVAKRSTACCPR